MIKAAYPTFVRTPEPQARRIIIQILLAFGLGFVLFFLSVGLFMIGFEIWYMGRIYPGVTVDGVDLGGLHVQDAIEKITQKVDFPTRGRLVLRDGQNLWMVSPGEIGLFLDAEASARAAFKVGRQGNILGCLEEQFNSAYYGYALSPTFVFDQRVANQYLSSLRDQVDVPVVEAELNLQGTEVVVRPGQNGREMDIPATLQAVSSQLYSLQDGIVDLVVQDKPAVIIDATEQANLARAILSQPLVLTMPDGQPDQQGPWTFDVPALASMLRLERVKKDNGEVYQVAINGETLRSFLTDKASGLQMTPVNARFTFNEETHQLEVLQHAVIGRELDVDASVSAIQKKILAGEHKVSLVFKLTPPPATDQMKAKDLGIQELIESETTYFYGSNNARVQNITIAAARFHGLLVAPGETFSMAQALGDVSLDNGYAEALIIYGNQTIKGVGGGVCQVSTTLFRAAFFAGFPIVERHPHAYRVFYYEKTAGNHLDSNLAGLDATVYVPVVDFKFTNDTPYWLLMETFVDPASSSITWNFYSTSDGRKVNWETSGLTDVVAKPKPLYRENSDLSKGTVKQVDWGVDGATISVTRTVYRNGGIYFKDTYTTVYEPWQDIYEYGPGTKGMPPPDQ